mmetsp:Transcript_21044/g.27285  ORF Transcript_21044/g.27285 Transcript_21044/m.27285 type:complete len:92 (+) Transcript_21044:34-309(+)
MKLRHNVFIKHGLPLVLFVAGGSWILSQFTSGTILARDIRNKSKTERAFNLEEEYTEIQRKLFGNQEPSARELILKRIPRPDEEAQSSSKK